MAFLAVLLLSVFAVADPFKVSVKGNKKFLEFTSREGLFYKVPLNPQNSKFVYKEVTIKPGDYFIVSTTKPENPKGFAHVFRFDSLDPAKKILHLTDLATGTRQVTYEHEGTDYIGYIVAGGFSYAFSVDPKFNNCVDGLMILDLFDVPLNTLKALSKELEDDSILERFNF